MPWENVKNIIGQGGGSGSIAGISANGQGAPVSFKFIFHKLVS